MTLRASPWHSKEEGPRKSKNENCDYKMETVTQTLSALSPALLGSLPFPWGHSQCASWHVQHGCLVPESMVPLASLPGASSGISASTNLWSLDQHLCLAEGLVSHSACCQEARSIWVEFFLTPTNTWKSYSLVILDDRAISYCRCS